MKRDKITQTNIPLYDQYTGEPNADYERLTGTPNPLLNTYTDFSEPKRPNRFIFRLPEEFNIHPMQIQYIELPQTKFKKTKLLGLIPIVSLDFSDLIVGIVETTKTSVSRDIFKIFNSSPSHRFNCTLELLGPTGDILEEWLIRDCVIKEIGFTTLDYSIDDVFTSKLVISPSIIDINKFK